VTEPSEHWLASFEAHLLRRLLSARAFELALESAVTYREAPTRGRGDLVEATLEASPEEARVSLRLTPGDERERVLMGACSRCTPMFGPCAHMAVLAVDLAASAELRQALLDDTETGPVVAGAPARRRALRVERAFEGALGDWLGSRPPPRAIVLAAAPAPRGEAPVGRDYGARRASGDVPGAALAVFARPLGEKLGDKRLLPPRELVRLADFSLRDRRVLEHLSDRAGARKAALASGVEASLALEAMRVHGNVYNASFKAKLAFRAERVRPALRVLPAEPGAPERVMAVWSVGAGEPDVPVGEASFFPGPFPYVWTQAGALHPLEPDVDPDLVRRLVAAPTLEVPPGRLRDVGLRLFQSARARGVSLPSPETFGLPALEVPRFLLRVEGEPLAVRATLVALYARGEVVLAPTDASAPPPDPEGLRDLELEARALAHLGAAGLDVSPGDDDAREGCLEAAGEAAVRFFQTTLPALRALREPSVEIALSARLARVRVGAPVEARVHVVLEGGWLGTRVKLASGELAVELSRVRDALTANAGWVALDDGTLTRISAEVDALSREALQVLGESGAGLLPPHQLGRIDRWIEANDGRVDAAVKRLRKRLRALAVATEPDLPSGLVATLRPYQKLGLAWLQFLRTLGAGGLLADDMGLGKTVTTLAFLLREKELSGPRPSLVVCPTSVAGGWVREAERFTPGLRVRLYHGAARGNLTPEVLAEHDLFVTTYALLRRDVDALEKIAFRAVVLDEAQNVKSAESQAARAAGRLRGDLRLCLTGTPMENRLRELWSLASFANPGILGGVRDFERLYERPLSTDPSSAVGDELRALLRPFLLRRTKRDVLPELPPKTEIDRVVSLSRADRRIYDALAHTLRESVRRDIERRGLRASTLSVFTALTRLRQMACDPRLVDPRLSDRPSAKREAFLELARELSQTGRRALVFSQFVALLTLWRADLDAEGIAYEYLDGATVKRDEVVRRFQEGAAPLFLISLKAGGAGLNLTAADTVIHCDPWWNPAVEDQATDRAYRIGQDQPVTVVRLVARGTIEEKIGSLKAKKRALTSAIISDEPRALRGITEDDLRLLLGDAVPEALDAEEDAADDVREAAAAPTDLLATLSAVLDPDYDALVAEVAWWLARSGRAISELARAADVPPAFVARLAAGEPFPCSRAVASRLRARMETR